MKSIKISFLLFLITLSSFAQENIPKEPKWIWYPGDFEVWLHTVVGGRRQERGQPYPPFWRMDSHYGVVIFMKKYNNPKPETIQIYADGRYQIRLDGEIMYNFDPLDLQLPAGNHSIDIMVENYKCVPSLLVTGKEFLTDDSWQVTNQNQKFYNAASGTFSDPHFPPSSFHLSLTPVNSRIIEKSSNSMLVDFGKETFGKVIVENVKGRGKLKLYYGETRQEALAETLAETFDYIEVNRLAAANDTTAARAFRFIYLVCDQSVTADKIYSSL